MNYIRDIERYIPLNEQEATDQKTMLSFIGQHPYNVLLRDNCIAHITSSGFVMNERLDKVLLVHHNIRNVWAWTGGHADGDSDLLHVAIKEAMEETGIATVKPLSSSVASLDILPVGGHWRNGSFVNAHLHLSVAYILVCNDEEPIRPQMDENSAVTWVDTSFFTTKNFEPNDVYLYNKLMDKAKRL